MEKMVEINVKRIEKGLQLGIEKRIQREQKYFWYFYAVEKKNDIYYVYECEIAEDNMSAEIYEFENISKYLSVQEVIKQFPCKYKICFEDINVLKGQKIFNVNSYI